MFTSPLEAPAAGKAWGVPGTWCSGTGGTGRALARGLSAGLGQEVFRQPVFAGRAESGKGLQQLRWGGIRLCWCPEVPKQKAFALECHFFSMCISSPCSDQVESAGSWKKLS